MCCQNNDAFGFLSAPFLIQQFVYLLVYFGPLPRYQVAGFLDFTPSFPLGFNLENRLAFLICDGYLFFNAGRVVGILAHEDNHDVGLANQLSCLIQPTFVRAIGFILRVETCVAHVPHFQQYLKEYRHPEKIHPATHPRVPLQPLTPPVSISQPLAFSG